MERAHPPLRRVMHGSPQKVDPSLCISTATVIDGNSYYSPSSSSTCSSTPSTPPANVSTPSLPSPLQSCKQQALLPKYPTRLSLSSTPSGAGSWNLADYQQQFDYDSCYSSSSEESHVSLSRENSDGLSRKIAQLNIDEGVILETIDIPADLLQFARNVGYTEEQLRTVLNKVGAEAGQDRILAELVNTGQASLEKGQVEASASSLKSTSSPQLRSIVIDGSNIAMAHGRKEVFSCAGIRDCVQFFVDKGHQDILVFIPHFRREVARADCPLTDQHVLTELDNEGRIIWTPSRRINGRRIVCHDDRYILKTADEKDAVIVSNDEYRDLVRENPQYAKLVENRLLMYSFVDGKFMPPDDPLGRHGPTLDQFLSKHSSTSNSQLCPYARKCTYGNKCKYFHPERPNGVHVSATDRIIRERNQKKNPILHHSLSQMDSLNKSRLTLGRTRSLNTHMVHVMNQENNPMTVPITAFQPSWHPPTHQTVARNQSMPIPSTYKKQPQDIEYQQYNLFAPSTAVWGRSELSVGPVDTNNSSDSKDQERAKLQYNLCQLFPEAVVLNVMAAHPDETRSQVLCEHILAMNKRFYATH
ncbi:unnamed protein product [Auanema sp. JU1783]|nr:unnamed protein product [Auanema sp. JU1783]